VSNFTRLSPSRYRWIALAMASLLVFVACGGDGTTAETTAAPQAATPAEPAVTTTIDPGNLTTTTQPAPTVPLPPPGLAGGDPETPSITVMPAALAQFLPIFVAQDQGLFAEYGLTVEILEFEGGAGRSTEAVLAGEAQLGYTSWPLAFSLAERGQPLKFVTTHSYYARRDGKDYGTHRLIVPEDSPIQSVADLANTRVGVIARGSNEEAFLTSIFTQVGVDPSSVELVEAFWADHPGLLDSGDIDVGYMIYPFIKAIIPYGDDSGSGFRSIGDPFLGDPDMGMPEMLGDRGAGLFPMVATPEFVADNPNTIRAWALAIRDATTWIKNNPVEALEISVAATGHPAEAQRSNPPHLYVTWPDEFLDQLEFVATMMTESGLLESELDVTQFLADLPFNEADMTVEDRYVSWDPSELP